MGATRRGDGFSASYVHDDKEQRREFDRRLASYLRGHRERWDITAIVEPLELLGRKAGPVDVHLRRSAAGKLSVTIEFDLAPLGTGQGGGASARGCWPPPVDAASQIPNG